MKTSLTTVFLDILNTCVDVSSAEHEDIERYAAMRGKIGATWAPIELPTAWLVFPAWPDVAPALERMRLAGLRVHALSNVPSPMLAMMLQLARVRVDSIIPLDKFRVYKPNLYAYTRAIEWVNAQAAQCLMVTANKTFGDIEASKTVGMRAELLDRSSGYDLMALCDKLELA